ncbi:MAG: O-antigen ligase family protein [Clostridiales bacterium]|nr:O-antigen ligase family protein [Clostridiales bacterium]
MREKFDKIVNSRIGKGIDRFINTPWYSAVIAAICILCHTLDIPVVGAFLLTLTLVPALIFCKNSFVLVPFLFMCSFVISEDTMPQSGYYGSAGKLVPLCLMLAVLAAALVFNLVYYGKWKKIFKRAHLTVSLALCSGVLIVGGLFSPTFTLGGIGLALGIGVTMFFPYAFLINCGEYEGRKTIEYIAWATVAAAIVIGAAVFEQYAVHGFKIGNKRADLQFGYAISNTAAAIVVLAIPLTFYFVYKYKYGFLFLLLVALELFIIVATYSRATLVVAVPGTAIVAVWLCFKKKSGRLAYWIACGVAAVGVIALAVLFRNRIWSIVSAVFDGNISSSGRVTIWKEGFIAWKDSPFLGVGLQFLQLGGRRYYSFHCTPLTYLYCAGLVGLVAYGYHRYKTVRLTFAAKLTAERVFVALSVLAMVFNALLDIAMTLPPNLLYYSTLLALIEADVKHVKSSSAEIDELPEEQNIENNVEGEANERV